MGMDHAVAATLMTCECKSMAYCGGCVVRLLNAANNDPKGLTCEQLYFILQ